MGSTDEKQASIQRLLVEIREGDQTAFDRLVPLVYDELREVARRQRSKWSGQETVRTTVLVHEAYLKLAASSAASWQDRPHFLAVAARAMRQILVDHARRAGAGKRGGKSDHLPLDRIAEITWGFPDLSQTDSERLLSLNESLGRLEEESARHCRVVECRFFGDMTVEETAEALGLSPSTVKRAWNRARAWLHRDLQSAGSGG